MFSPILSAVDFLLDVNLGKDVKLSGKVFIVGGGNTAIDAARSAFRSGADSVGIIYRRTQAEMPAHHEEIEDAIDELKAEFDALIGDEGMEDDMDGEEDDVEMDDTEDFGADVADEDEDEDDVEESMVREYVEKVKSPSNVEGADNKTSTVAKKNDMGGSAANILGSNGDEKGGKTDRGLS